MRREDIIKDPALIESTVTGFTGRGYVGSGEEHARQQLSWNFKAPESGNYILEFRYTLSRDDVASVPLDINGKKVKDLEFWSTGKLGLWVWERVTVNLDKGDNIIGILPEKAILVDHLNIMKK